MPKKDSLHRVDHYLGIVKALDCDISGSTALTIDTERSRSVNERSCFFIAKQDKEFADEVFKKEGLKKMILWSVLIPGPWYP